MDIKQRIVSCEYFKKNIIIFDMDSSFKFAREDIDYRVGLGDYYFGEIVDIDDVLNVAYIEIFNYELFVEFLSLSQRTLKTLPLKVTQEEQDFNIDKNILQEQVKISLSLNRRSG